MTPTQSQLFARKEKVHNCGLRWSDGNWFLQGLRVAENRSLHFRFRQYIKARLLSGDLPAFVPCDEFVLAGGNIGHFKFAFFVAHGVLRMWDNKHLSIHPKV